jgi:NAD+ kinase
MKLGLLGRHLEPLKALLAAKGVEISQEPPWDLIIIRGGDGSLLGAERSYPGVPKLPLRDSDEAPLCPLHDSSAILDDFLAGRLAVSSLPKLCGSAKGRSLCGVNDVFIHSRNSVSAMRYKVWIDGQLYAEEIVGDGACVSTVHGSTAYYRSITHSVFRVGIGLAFSNSTELVNHLVLPAEAEIKFRISRGPAEIVADNSPDPIQISGGDEAAVRMLSDKATVLGLDVFMCEECRRLRRIRRAKLPPLQEPLQ